MTAAVPLIDFTPFLSGSGEERARVAQVIGLACEEIGFFMPDFDG